MHVRVHEHAGPSRLLCLILAALLQPHITGSIADARIHVKDGLQVSETKLYLQKGQTQRITCLLDYEDAVSISFSRVSSSPDGTSNKLLLRADKTQNNNFTAGDRYKFTPDYRMVIVSIVEGDSGVYECQKVSTNIDNNVKRTVEVLVLDRQLPPVTGSLRENVSVTVQRDAKDISLSCPIKEASALNSRTIYWSMEVDGLQDYTRIIAIAFSDGELTAFDGYQVSSGNELLLATAPSTERASFLCHVSSTVDGFYMQSGKVSVEVPGDNSTAVGIAVSVVAVLLLLLAILLFVCYRRKGIFRRTKYIPVSIEMKGPIIIAGMDVQWKHECNLGPRGVITEASNYFSGVKSIVLNTKLAVLDDSGVHIFSDDLLPLKHPVELQQPPESYVAMVSHSSHEGLLLGAQDGTVYHLDTTSWKEKVLCPLNCEEEETASHSKKKSRPSFKWMPKPKPKTEAHSQTPPTSTPEPPSNETMALDHSSMILVSMTVDQNGNIFVGDATTNSVIGYYSAGVFMNRYAMQFPPRILAARSAGEFLTIDNHGDIRLFTATRKTHGRVFIPNSQILKPVNVIVDNSSVFVVSDTRCGRQNEIIQFDKDGKFIRQFVKPWPGVRGFGVFPSGERLAVYDESVVRIYKKCNIT